MHPQPQCWGGQGTRRLTELSSPLSGSRFSERLSQGKAGRDKKATRCLSVVSLHISTGLIITHTYITHTACTHTTQTQHMQTTQHTWTHTHTHMCTCTHNADFWVQEQRPCLGLRIRMQEVIHAIKSHLYKINVLYTFQYSYWKVFGSGHSSYHASPDETEPVFPQKLVG